MREACEGFAEKPGDRCFLCLRRLAGGDLEASCRKILPIEFIRDTVCRARARRVPLRGEDCGREDAV